jgi:nicotinamidase-related amidase
MTLSAVVRTRELVGEDGARDWRIVDAPTDLVPTQTAVILCDVWDRHWCPTAQERLEAMVPAMNRLVAYLRQQGVLIVHSPSETMDYYADHPARQRVLDAGPVDSAAPARLDTPELPVQVGATHGCDAAVAAQTERVWTRQHPGIGIDAERDLISDDGSELAHVFRRSGISTVLIMGVHTNMCVLDRSFGIRALVGYGFRTVLIRDLTDAMYDPADPPYVSHDEGTRLLIEYIEKFLCDTALGAALLPDRSSVSG